MPTAQRSLVLLCIVSGQLQAPEVAFHRLLAARLVLLLAVRDLVRRDLREVFLAESDVACYSGEADTQVGFVALQRRSALVGFCLTEVETVAVLAGGFCDTVGTDDVVATGVTIFLLGFSQCSADGVNTRRPSYFCHSLLAILGRGLT